MKKLLSWLLALSMMLPMCVTASAEDSTEWAPTATSYTADVTNANELSKWKLVKGTANESISNGVLNWGSNDAAYILPIAAMSDVLVEVDLTHTGGNTSFDIAFGLDENGSNINNNRMYFISKPGARTLLKYAGTTTVSRYAGDNNGYQWNINRYLEGGVVSDYYQSMKFKLVIYNKRLAAWANDQLVYTYTLDDAYTGGYVALSPRTYRSIIRSVTARAATASDMVFAESFAG